MRVDIVGGGPGGLYAGILLKLRDPSHDVRIYERNQAGDTFGFGVVFSDATLANFEAADAVSHGEILASFAYWSDIDIHWKGEVVRSTGHGFCGMARVKLLDILARRAVALGCDLQFSTDIPPDTDHADADVVIAADGIRSGLRTRFADHFLPSFDWRRCRFIWLGTSRPLSAFTFWFKETPFGIFQVHAYPYDDGHSTFIVECHEDVWARAGLDRKGEEEGVAWLRELFAGELEGHPLNSRNSGGWRQFPTIRNARWWHDKFVIIGDAAHTAHFSIGSGTKLAMEDSIALVDALHGAGTVPVRLAAYDAARRPEVERIQHSAQTSLEWFENTNRYVGQPAIQLAFSLMTRSKRITWEELRKRDPALVEATRAWFGGPRSPSPVFTPYTVRGLTLRNRVVVSPMCQYSAVEGVPSDWHLVHLGSRAVGGAGLVMAEATGVERPGRISPGCTGLWNDEQQAAWARIVRFVHNDTGAKIGMQLAHAGRKGSTARPWEGSEPLTGDEAWPTFAPSAVPYAPGWHVPEAMDEADLARVRHAFGVSARRAKEAGFDWIEIHMAHGYLLNTFLSSLSNHRTDTYGGSLENRLRFPLEVVDAVRAEWDGPLSARISATEWAMGGLDDADRATIGRALHEHGVDLVDVSAGGVVPEQSPVYGRMFQVGFSDQIRYEAGIPTIAVGNIQDLDQANTVLAAGRADLIAFARPHLNDPYLAMHGAADEGVADDGWPRQYLAGRPRSRKG